MSLLRYIKSKVRRYRRPVCEALGIDRYSYMALNELDKKLKKHLNFNGGFFIECGANDGLRQSNTYWFERFQGWHGLLIEADPKNAAKCRINRPRDITINTALVADDKIKTVKIHTADLMAYVDGGITGKKETEHRAAAQEVQHLTGIGAIDVPARTLSSVLDELNIQKIDFFSLDVEGYELDVLRGLNLERHAPTYLLVETTRLDEIQKVLQGRYEIIEQLSHHDYLLKKRTAAPSRAQSSA